MGMKFLNKKGWHTGSLRNIENVWKAEQKKDAEDRKLEELRKQIREEKERDEFRQLQEQAGFAPRQERLEFLYDSGLSVGKSSNEGFSALQSYPPVPAAPTSNSASASAAPASIDSSTPGALFEEKPQSANDAWRKLHSDPLLMIRQREQEALARIKNNPVKMAMIRKSVETKMKDDEANEKKQKKLKSKHKKHSSSKHRSDTENDSDEDKARKRKYNHKANKHLDSGEDTRDKERRHGNSHKDHGSENLRRDSPVKQKPDGIKGCEGLDFNEESRDGIKHRRQSHRDYRSEKSHGSPVNQKHLDSDEDTRDKERRHGHSHKDHGSEKWRRDSLVKQKPDGIKGCERLDFNEESRDVIKHRRHSHRDYRSEKSHGSPVNQKADENSDREHSRRGNSIRHEKCPLDSRDDKSARKALDNASSSHTAMSPKHDPHKRWGKAPQLTEEERAARSREMQMDDKSGRKTLDNASSSHTAPKHESHRRRGKVPQLTEEERAARLKEMQMDAELHEEQRFKRLKKAEDDDAREASKATVSRGSSFLNDVQKSVYGAEKGGSSTIEESVRRRSHFHQGRTEVDERNAFRR